MPDSKFPELRALTGGLPRVAKIPTVSSRPSLREGLLVAPRRAQHCLRLRRAFFQRRCLVLRWSCTSQSRAALEYALLSPGICRHGREQSAAPRTANFERACSSPVRTTYEVLGPFRLRPAHAHRGKARRISQNRESPLRHGFAAA